MECCLSYALILHSFIYFCFFLLFFDLPISLFLFLLSFPSFSIFLAWSQFPGILFRFFPIIFADGKFSPSGSHVSRNRKDKDAEEEVGRGEEVLMAVVVVLMAVVVMLMAVVVVLWKNSESDPET